MGYYPSMGPLMRLRVYLDTSVLSVYLDDRTPDRRDETRLFWARLSEFEASTSELTREELALTPDEGKREQLISLLQQVAVWPITGEMRQLAHRYVEEEVFAAKVFNDALHVAAAVLTRHDVLVSWNFKHLVNRGRRARINDINIALQLPTIEIVAPPEV